MMIRGVAGVLFIVMITVEVMAQPGRVYPAEWKEFPSLVTDYTVVQLTTDRAEDIRLYFYNDGFIPATNSVVFSSTRSGGNNLFLVNLGDGRITQVTNVKLIQGGGAVTKYTISISVTCVQPTSQRSRPGNSDTQCPRATRPLRV
jgi:hypothetical protein